MEQEIKTYNVNGEMVWTGHFNKIKGVIQEKPVPFRICPLNINNAEIMGNFSHTIYENLRLGEECFIHKHTKEYYYQIFQNTNVKYIGVFVGEKLIGMSSLTICHNREELEEELPNSSYNFFREDRNNNQTKIASFGADSVLPEYRGNKLNIIMINYRMEEAKRQGCTDCTSIVDRNNRWNMTPYFTCRFNLFETAIDPSDGGEISLLHRPIAQNTVLSCIKTRVSIPYDRLELIDNMIQKGFIGIEFNSKTADVTFAHSAYYNQKKNTRESEFMGLILHERQRKVI